MATLRTRTIGDPDLGRDFETIAAWRDHADADDLVSNDWIWQGRLYPEGLGTNGEWTERLTFSGMGTDATRYVELMPADGEGFADKQVRGSDSRKYDNSKGVAWAATAFYGTGTLTINNNHVYIRGLQMSCNGNGPAIANDATTPHVHIIGNFIQQTGSVAPIVKRGDGGSILNNYIIATGSQSIGLDTRIVGNIPIKYNLIARPSDSASVGTGDAISSHSTFTPIITGNVALGFSRFSESASANAASDYNQSDTTSNLLGSNSTGTRTYAGNYAGHTAAGQNWFLLDNPEFEDVGPTTDSHVTDDVHGTSRPQNTNYDPGPEELIAAGGGQDYPYTGSGGISFAGAATLEKIKIGVPSGGISFAGSAIVIKNKIAIPAGGITFSGAATTSVNNTASHEYIGQGGISFSGEATIAKDKIGAVSGGIQFGGEATYSFDSAADVETGGIHPLSRRRRR